MTDTLPDDVVERLAGQMYDHQFADSRWEDCDVKDAWLRIARATLTNALGYEYRIQPADAPDKPEPCQIRWCKSGLPGTVSVSENIGDGLWRLSICQQCADIIGMKDNDVLPTADTVEAMLAAEKDG